MGEEGRLIEQLNAARDRMRALVEDIDAEWEIYPGWTIKHIMAHLTGWDDITVQFIRAHLSGKPVDDTAAQRGSDYYNAQTVATREAFPFRHVLAEWEQARQQLKMVVDELSSEQLEGELLAPWGSTGTIAQTVGGLAQHELEHAEEIARLNAERE